MILSLDTPYQQIQTKCKVKPSILYYSIVIFDPETIKYVKKSLVSDHCAMYLSFKSEQIKNLKTFKTCEKSDLKKVT